MRRPFGRVGFADLLRLLAARGDRLAGFGAVDWDKALGWLRGGTGAELAPCSVSPIRAYRPKIARRSASRVKRFNRSSLSELGSSPSRNAETCSRI